MKTHLIFTFGLLIASSTPLLGEGKPLPTATPAKYGFSTQRLEKLHDVVQSYVDTGKHAGALSMIVRADLWNAPSFKEFIQRVGKLPLKHQPGEAFLYGINIDILGYLVEVVSGQKFEDFLQERLFNPLGMKDTTFLVPENKRNRLAKIYELGPDGKLRPAKAILDSYHGPNQGFPSGGGGLFSTIDDYARFGQMLLNGGKLDGKQILGRKTVELMMANHLNYLERQTHIWSNSDGFGLGGAVRIDLAKGNNLGSIGQFGWTGAATTYFNLDPKEKTLALLFIQHFPHDQHGIFSVFSTLFYQSLVD